MSESLRNYLEALAWFQHEQKAPYGNAPTKTGNWGGYCLTAARSSYGIPARDGSAIASWYAADPEDRHPLIDLSSALLGSALIWSGGSKGYGHIAVKAYPFKNGAAAVWGNDMIRYGMLDKHRVDLPRTVWGLNPKGYLTAINGYDLRLKEKKPPKPKDDKPYKGIQRAINNLEHSLEVARNERDHHDIVIIRKAIRINKRMYSELRHS